MATDRTEAIEEDIAMVSEGTVEFNNALAARIDQGEETDPKFYFVSGDLDVLESELEAKLIFESQNPAIKQLED